MSENLAGLLKIIGITILLVVLWCVLATQVPETFLSSNNIENLLRRTALYGILGIGVAFVIISSGIDLSIGSLVCLCGCLLAMFLHVDFVPQDAMQVTSMKPDSVVVESVGDLSTGQQLWYFRDRRDNRLLTVKSVAGNDVVFNEMFSDRSLKASELGLLIPVYGIKSIDGLELVLETPIAGLRTKDRMRFVSAKSSAQNQPVVAIDGGQTLQLKAEPAGVNANDFFAVPSKRTAMMPIPMAIAAVLGIALLIGVFHGFLITKLKQQPFIVTLSGLLAYRGLSRWLTNDQTVGFIEYQDSLGALATGRWILWEQTENAASFGIPYSFFVLVVVAALAIIFLNSTIWGRYMLALGRNEEAARYSGINTGRITILAYVLCAVLTAIGGILFALDSNSIAPSSFGNFFELYAIAAAVLGGCSLRGGEGSIIGVVVGTALMQTLYNSIVLLKIPDELEYTIIGAVILIGVVSDEVIRRFATYLKSSRNSPE